MGKKIIVAGAGHGGLAAAALLAGAGHDVTVCEARERKNLGHDWTDIFEITCFDNVGIPRPPKDHIHFEYNITYTNPAGDVQVVGKTNTDPDHVIMDRKYLINCLVRYASQMGVKFKFGEKVICPIIDGNKVKGVITKSRLRHMREADLVIDAAGLNSPVRRNLPARFGIISDLKPNEVLSSYRAFYEKIPGEEPEQKHIVHFYHNREPGLDWMITNRHYMDVLVGRFGHTLTQEQVDDAIADFKKVYPTLGDKIVRGGSYYQIPIRRTLPVFVADGYAAVGDSAAMTIPMPGSGIENSINAGKILAEVVNAAGDEKLTADVLWEYAYRYHTEIGFRFLTVDIFRKLATALDADDVDFLLQKEILTANELGMSSDSMSMGNVIGKAVKLFGKLGFLPKTLGALTSSRGMKEMISALPEKYDKKAVAEWAKVYEGGED